ncbi:MAG: ribosome maturation factor RimP [Myxococcota bacterium]
MKDPVAEMVGDAVRSVLGREGFDLVLVEYIPRSRTLRLYIDREAAAGQSEDDEAGVTIDDCSSVSRLVSDVLDGQGISDRIDGRYTLEVSSPGLDRPLTRPKDFRRFEGSEVKVSTVEPLEGRKRFRGTLLGADEDAFRVDVDGREWSIGYGLVDKARLVPEFD